MLTFSFATQGTLKKVTEKKAASELCILSFKNDCITFLSAIIIKLLEGFRIYRPISRLGK